MSTYADGSGGGRTARIARGTIEDGRAWVRTVGGAKTAVIYKEGGARVDKMRETTEGGRGWGMTAGGR